MEKLWNVVQEIIDTCLRESIIFHDVIHGFRTGRGTETAILEFKLGQDLASINKDLLFLFFMNLLKSYDTVDWGCLLTTL